MKYLLPLLALLFATAAVVAAPIDPLQQGWAVANYELEGDEQIAAFEQLIVDAQRSVAQYPDDAGVYIWQGIIQSTYAGTVGGLGALKWVKAARKSLEQAMEIDAMALQGSAYTSLGALYYQVPGWPIAFGSAKKAQELLEAALQINPDGIDPNYFYADFLVNQKEYDRARLVLIKALAADARPGRELADNGRRNEIRQLLARIDGES
ncbi:MAG: tetratricopeptide repeat protein [Pseudomonadales bacterium]